VSLYEGTLAATGKYDELVLLSLHLRPKPERQIDSFSHFRATVCKTVHPMLSVRSPSVCLSVLSCWCIVAKWLEWIKVKLGKEIGLGPGHIVLDRDAAPPPQRAQPPISGPCLLWPYG